MTLQSVGDLNPVEVVTEIFCWVAIRKKNPVAIDHGREFL
jgi:hypothetical protein